MKDAQDEEVLDFAAARRSLHILIDVITAIRKLRIDRNVDPGKEIDITIVSRKFCDLLESQEDHIRRMCKIKSLSMETDQKKRTHVTSTFLTDIEVHLSLEGLMDVEAERKKLQKEKEDLECFVQGIEATLQNADFTSRAPEKVIAAEREKLHAHGEKLRKVKERLKVLG